MKSMLCVMPTFVRKWQSGLSGWVADVNDTFNTTLQEGQSKSVV